MDELMLDDDVAGAGPGSAFGGDEFEEGGGGRE